MPISEKIMEEINKLAIETDEKQLLIDLLQVDEAGKQYSKEYDKLIKEYIKVKEKVNGI